MDLTTLPVEDQPLAKAAAEFFFDHFERPKIRILEAIDEDLRWRPHLHFKTHNMIVAAEISQEPFPANLSARAMDLVHTKPNVPVAIYSICPLDVVQRRQPEVNRLREHGFGLITIDVANNHEPYRQFGCIPYNQHIPRAELISDIAPLTKDLRLRFRGAYDIYTGGQASSGVQEIRQILEDLLNGAVRGSIAKGWAISAGPGKPALSEAKALRLPASRKVDVLCELHQFRKFKTDLILASHFLRDYGNPNSHPGKTRQDAIDRMNGVRMGFKTGINVAIKLREAIAGAGLKPKLIST